MKDTERNKRSNRMILKFALMMIYLTALSYGLFFSDRLGRTTEHWHTVNLIPFKEITRYITRAESLGFEIVCINIVGNVVAFLPFGFLIPSIWPENDKRHPIGILILSLIFSATVEVLQYLTNVGSADIDDVILNTLGGCLGYMLYALWRRIRYGGINVTEDR